MEINRYNRIAQYEARRGVLMRKSNFDDSNAEDLILEHKSQKDESYLDELYNKNYIKAEEVQQQPVGQWFKTELNTEYYDGNGNAHANINYDQHQGGNTIQTVGFEHDAITAYPMFQHQQQANYNVEHHYQPVYQQEQQYYGPADHYQQQLQQQQMEQQFPSQQQPQPQHFQQPQHQSEQQPSQWSQLSEPVSDEPYYNRLVIDESAVTSNHSSPVQSHSFVSVETVSQSYAPVPISGIVPSETIPKNEDNVYTRLA